MAIDIKKSHSKPLAEAKTIADELAQDLSERFGVHYQWEGDHLHFERMGVSGNIQVTSKEVHVTAHLNFFISHLEPAVIDEVNRYLDEHFS